MELLTHPIFLLAVYMTACYILTLLIRKVVETAKPDLKKQADANSKKVTYKTPAARWWNEVILYSIAPVIGAVLSLGLRDTEAFPDIFKGNTLSVLMAGLTCGFLCSWFFKVFKRMFSKSTGVSEKELDEKDELPQVPGGE